MRIGLSGGASSVDRMIEQAVQAEADGFTSLWYASAIGGDPLIAIALAGRATTSLELGTAVLQTYTCHPVLQANRAAAVVAAMGRAGFTLGVGPSHQPVIEMAPRSTSPSSPACCGARRSTSPARSSTCEAPAGR